MDICSLTLFCCPLIAVIIEGWFPFLPFSFLPSSPKKEEKKKEPKKKRIKIYPINYSILSYPIPSLPFRSGLFGSVRTREIILDQEGRQREPTETQRFGMVIDR